MPNGGSIIRAYRDRRIVERRQQIGPNVPYFCGRLPQGVHHIGDMLKGQLPETVLYLGSRDVFAPDPDRRRITGQNLANQFQQTIGIVVDSSVPARDNRFAPARSPRSHYRPGDG